MLTWTLLLQKNNSESVVVTRKIEAISNWEWGSISAPEKASIILALDAEQTDKKKTSYNYNLISPVSIMFYTYKLPLQVWPWPMTLKQHKGSFL